MLSLRILRGARTTALLRWALVTAASAATGLLLLSALGYALGHPEPITDAAVRLAWCVVPVVVTVRLAVVAARAVPTGWPRTGLSAVGLGPVRVALLAATTTAVACGVGSGIALLVFLHLRGDLAGVPFDGAGSDGLGDGRPLPLAGTVTLLALVPVAAAAIGAATLWPARTGHKAPPKRQDPPAAPAVPAVPATPVAPAAPAQAPAGVPWGVALTAVGLAIEVSAPGGTPLPLPGGLGSITPAAVGGWIVTTVGMVLAAPGVVYACGWLLAAYRPGAVRMLAGRALQDEARRLGRPLGVVSATTTAALAAYPLHQDSSRPFGPLTTMAFAVIAACVLATAATSVFDIKRTREPATAALRQLGASPTLLRT
ncbi:MAG TPA: hypothetical protein VGL02_24425, partial [Streptomyces sp.]